jgi:2,3-bisphosphoglycerate-independent phosphoglycerate mutase
MVVMDGIGLGRGDASDAVAQARTPTLDSLMALRSFAPLRAHGTAVGMPSDKDMGNSEVGHNAIGAGRVFEQGAALVQDAIDTGRIFDSAAWTDSTARVRASGEPLHFIGLLSDGNVHSHIDHLVAMIERCAVDEVPAVRVHALLDGRDVPVRSALDYVDRLEQVLEQHRGSGRDYRVASGGGRMTTTMDRYEADWSMVERGWRHHVRGEGRRFASLREAVLTLYDESELGDQDLPAFVIADDDGPTGPIRDGAAVVFFNFRGDRALEISQAFDDDRFEAFDRGPRPDVLYAGMMEYDGDRHVPRRYLVEPPAIDRTMGELLARSGRRQVAVAETHKFGHVTYFWNGNRSEPFDARLERYLQIRSDLEPEAERPWMKAAEVTDTVISSLRPGDGAAADLVRVNYANGDMVGHTGVFESTRIACEVVDLCLQRLVAATRAVDGVLLVTADHGNADHMFDDVDGDRRVRTSHSLNPVPFLIFDPREAGDAPALDREIVASQPGLGNLAATALELMGFATPEGYLPSLLADAGDGARGSSS